MALRAADPKADVLTPKLTEWDRRVLSKLVVWKLGRDEPIFKDAWEVARELRADDVADVRRTLDGLCNFHYAMAKGWDHKRRWLALDLLPDESESCGRYDRMISVPDLWGPEWPYGNDDEEDEEAG